MTDQDREFLARINKYAEQVMGDIDPQKTQVSVQLDKLKPIFEELAAETGMSLPDVFIKYMDLQSEAVCATDKKMRETYADVTGDVSQPFEIR